MKKTIRELFLAIGFGTVIFVPMLIIDNGLNETLKSVLVWLGASLLYGLSFSLLRTKLRHRLPIHIAACFGVTLGVRCLYSYFTKGSINFAKLLPVTALIFVFVYIGLFTFMKYFANERPGT